MTIGKAAFPLLFCRKAEQTDRRLFSVEQLTMTWEFGILIKVTCQILSDDAIS